MRFLSILALLIVVAAVGLGLWVRLAPSDPQVWNQMPETASKGVRLSIDAGPDGLARLSAVATATPRTSVLAGSVEAGRMTWVTRSKVMGFPDYTTAQQQGDVLTLWARQRFGEKDFGVNAARLAQWQSALAQPQR
jgi:hypothetical protein